MKTCSSCNKEKHKSEFIKHHRRCKECYSVVKRDARYLKRYGITLEDYDEMYDEQKGRCAICNTTEPGGSRNRFCVDHNHETGKVRGLLCYRCNVGIGWMGDSPKNCLQAYRYLMSAGWYGES